MDHIVQMNKGKKEETKELTTAGPRVLNTIQKKGVELSEYTSEPLTYAYAYCLSDRKK